MITHLRLQNFKAWQDSGNVEFGPITAFFGSNSSGKTSFLQSMLLLKQTAESSNRGRVFDLGGGPASLVSLGTFFDLVFQHHSKNTVGVEIGWREDKAYEIQNADQKGQGPTYRSRELSLLAQVQELRHFMVAQRIEYRLGGTGFSLERVAGDKDEYVLDSRRAIDEQPT